MELDDIVSDITRRTAMTAEDAGAAVQVFIDIVKDELKNDGKVSVDEK